MASPGDAGAPRPDPPDVLDRVCGALHVRKSGGSTGGALPGEGGCNLARSCHGRCLSAPRTAPRKGGAEVKLCHLGEEKIRVCCDEELETSFTYIDENVNLRLASPETSCKSTHRPTRNGEPCSETFPDLSFMSDDDLSFGEGSGSSIDYGFISAVTFLVTGISLVIISYAVPARRGGGPRQRLGEGNGEAGDGERTDRRPPGPVRHSGTVPAHAGRRCPFHAAHDLHVERGNVQEKGHF
ncbi:hypothetical protein Q5P01_010851 [Channa striata]|uniref:Uncharacterized protein n=1 Tax=Channa striata TaxID=64152 RepID=A0AA88MW88_CHASR|nr:hypothetical protein Q5P01_010851 [Channa striata]